VDTAEILAEIIEEQLSDATRLKRVVAFFQRELGAIFGNARVDRRNRRYEILVAVYEKPLGGDKTYRMPNRQISEWIRQAANRAHPRLYKRLTVQIGKWQQGGFTHKLFTPVTVVVDANQAPAQPDVNESVE
jgi:hypothetical protein